MLTKNLKKLKKIRNQDVIKKKMIANVEESKNEINNIDENK